MPLIRDVATEDLEKIHHPGEPDKWVRMRPMVAGVHRTVTREIGPQGTTADYTAYALTHLIAEWSYPDPICIDSIDHLDGITFSWLQGLIDTVSGVRTEAEKNGSGAPSSEPPPSPTEGPPEN